MSCAALVAFCGLCHKSVAMLAADFSDSNGDAEAAPTTDAYSARRACAPDYDGDASAGRVLRLALEEGATMAAINARALLGADAPDATHQLRVGLRRLRAALWAGRRLGAAQEMRALGARARDLGRAVSRARALDALIVDTLPRLEPAACAVLGDEAPLLALRKRLDRAAARERKMLRKPPILLEAAALALDLSAAARRLDAPGASKDIGRPAKRWARKTLDRARRGVLRHPQMFDAMSIEERHELRKDAKRLRYALDAFRPLFSEAESAPMRRAVRRLGNALGSLNDAAEVAHLRAYAPERKYEAAIAALLTAAEAEAEADAPKAAERWTVLQAAPRFW